MHILSLSWKTWYKYVNRMYIIPEYIWLVWNSCILDAHVMSTMRCIYKLCTYYIGTREEYNMNMLCMWNGFEWVVSSVIVKQFYMLVLHVGKWKVDCMCYKTNFIICNTMPVIFSAKTIACKLALWYVLS